MSIIYETDNFILESHEKPEVDRLDGGHIKINPKISVIDRTFLTPKQLIELMRFSVVAGTAFVNGMKKRGVNIGRINYQDNGNWKPELHIHLYGRAIDAKYQKYGDPIIPGHKDNYSPLDEEDIKSIRSECNLLFSLEEFSDKNWSLN